jgi:hypothetical protein
LDFKSIKNTKIASEFSDEQFNEWFYYKPKKFINHIDTLYFSVFVDTSDWVNDDRKTPLIDYLRQMKNDSRADEEPKSVFTDIMEGLEIYYKRSFVAYDLCISLANCFDIFICEVTPNTGTNQINVQLRSDTLWLDGVKNSFDVACDVVSKILAKYDMQILKVQENRIDYAFHTNYIQDFLNFFPERNLRKMQISNFEWATKRYCFEDDCVLSDYFTLGSRASKNVFFRCYNKSKEVIQMGHKAFFFQIWHDNDMISNFDKYIMEKAFIFHNYNYKDKARCEFYLEYGSDFSLKRKIQKMLDDNDTTLLSYKKMADGLVPDLTLICNLEFQTKRDYYYRLKIPDVLPDDTSYKKRVYNLFEQVPCLIDRLTSQTLRFVKYKGKYSEMIRYKRPNAEWWDRLRKSKSFEFSSNLSIDYVRNYENNLNEQLQTLLAINSLASKSAFRYVNSMNKYKDFIGCDADLQDFYSYINDNDFYSKRYYKKRASKLKELEKHNIINNNSSVKFNDNNFYMSDSDVKLLDKLNKIYDIKNLEHRKKFIDDKFKLLWHDTLKRWVSLSCTFDYYVNEIIFVIQKDSLMFSIFNDVYSEIKKSGIMRYISICEKVHKLYLIFQISGLFDKIIEKKRDDLNDIEEIS